MKKSAIIIGSGFSGLSAAAFMAKAGYGVTVLEKHATPGGRARQLREGGFLFDMGPSWYWMPDVFDRFFSRFGKKVSDYYKLSRLDPSYRVYWKDDFDDIPAGANGVKQLFEKWSPGSSEKLDTFLSEAACKYRLGMQQFVYKPSLQLSEFARRDVLSGVMKMDVFSNVRKHLLKHFNHPKITQLLEFPVLFLGALPENTPALYTLMNYADIEGGTWYPQGGMYSVVDAMYKLALELGVTFQFSEEVKSLDIEYNHISAVVTHGNRYRADVIISSADYHYTDQHLLPEQYRMYSPKYWSKRTMAPSCLLYFVGLNKKLRNVQHHNLFFDTSFEKHSEEIYTTKQWPGDPLFYACVTSVTDDTVAPAGHENLFLLVPVAAGLTGDDEMLREKYFQKIIKRFESHIGESVTGNIVYKKSFACADFVNEYHSFRGNAYGLANTLTQTAFLRPKCKSSKVKNLYYTGQLTVPGPGVPPGLISGEVVASLASSDL